LTNARFANGKCTLLYSTVSLPLKNWQWVFSQKFCVDWVKHMKFTKINLYEN